MMSPGGSLLLAGNENMFRKFDAVDKRGAMFTAGSCNFANYYDNFQNRSMTSNNERRATVNKSSKGLIRFIGSAGSGS